MKRRTWSRSLARMAPLPFIGGHVGGLVFVLMALGLLVFSVFVPQGVSGVRTSVADAFSPVLNAVGQPVQKAAVFIRDVSGLAELQAENMRLRQENMRLREWYQTALVLEAKNKSLEELLNVKLEPQNRFITARVLADSGNTFVKSLLVAAGHNDGVMKGQAALSGDGVIGRVVETGNRASRVLLVTDINSRVPILVEDTRQHAVLAGENESLPRLVHIPPDSDIKEGARIITSGHGGLFPQGLPIGRVVIDKEGFRRVELFADFSRMVYVRLVDRPEDPNIRRGALN